VIDQIVRSGGGGSEDEEVGEACLCASDCHLAHKQGDGGGMTITVAGCPAGWRIRSGGRCEVVVRGHEDAGAEERGVGRDTAVDGCFSVISGDCATGAADVRGREV